MKFHDATPTPLPNLVDIDAIAAQLGVTVRHVRRLVAERRIPYVKWGHLLRFDPAAVASWLDAQRVEPAPIPGSVECTSTTGPTSSATAIHVRPSTRRGYRQALAGHLRPAFGTRPIGSIDRADIKRWATEKLDSGISSKTIRNWLSVMILVFEEAIDAKALRENPARGVKLPRTQRTEPQFFTAEQIERLADAMEPTQYAFLIRFAAYTGLRPGEIAGLRVRRLDLHAGRVEVCETLIPVDGKLVAGPTKTYSNRTVPLPAFLRDQADDYLAWLVEDQGRPLEPDDYVFRAVKGGPLDRQRFREKIMRPALRRAGLPEAFRAHDLRHTCASLMISLGAHPKLVMERLGHSDISITMGVYGHVFESLHEHMTEELDVLYRTAIGTQ